MATHYWMKKKYTADEIREIQRIIEMTNVTSLSTPVGDEGSESEMGDFIIDETPSPQEIVEERDRNEFLLEAIHACLKPREEKVIIELYGLETGQRKTLQEVGDMFNVTRERIRQIEAKAIRHLKWYIMTKKKIKGWEDI